MPILGIVASSISGGLLATSYNSISTVTVSSPVSSISFTSIPATFTHLQIRGIASNTANINEGYRFRFNSDTAGNYSAHRAIGDGTSIAADGNANISYAGEASSTNSPVPQTFSTLVYDVLDYTNTNKYKTVRALSGKDTNGGGKMTILSGNWRDTAAITSITIFTIDANFAQYTQFALYGIKGA